MRNIFAIIKKELKIYFNSPIAYIFLVVFLLISSMMFFMDFFLLGRAEMRYFFEWLPIIFIPFIPAVTMRLWAEEKKQGTIELLLTLPIKDIEVVIGKYAATSLFILLSLVLTFSIPLILGILGNPDWGVIFTSYFGSFLLAISLIAIGMTISIFTSNQIIAWILSTAVFFILLLIGFPFFLNYTPEFLINFFENLGFMSHYRSFIIGVIDSSDIIYYLSLISLFLLINVIKLDSRRY